MSKKRWRRIPACRICNTEKNNISKSPDEIEITEIFKPARKRFPTRHVIQRSIDDTWQADLYTFYRPQRQSDDPSYNLRSSSSSSSSLRSKSEPVNEYKHLLKANDDYKYILNVIDISSKYAWCIPLKTKTGLEVSKAFENILTSSKRIPKHLHVDKGKEFYNKDFKQVLDKYDIQMYSTGTDNKASIVERFNRTLGDKLKPLLYKNHAWLNVFPKIVKSYNNSYHRTIKMKPATVNKKAVEKRLLSTVYSYEITVALPKFEIGDRVRLSAYVDQFRNKLKTNWTREIFTIIKVIKSNVNYYKVDGISEGVYEEEMQLTLL